MRVTAHLTTCLLLLAAVGTAIAQDIRSWTSADGHTTTRYVMGGVGSDSRDELRAMSGSFPQRLIFAESGAGKLAAAVLVRLLDAKGRLVLEVEKCDPWLLLDLPTGTYRLEATWRDQRVTRSLSLTQGAPSEETVLFKPAP